MCRSKISIHIDVRYKKSYTVKKVPEVAAGMKNKILVIEDDRAISELLCMNLEAAGYETVAAYDGEEAQRLLLWHEDADMAVVDIIGTASPATSSLASNFFRSDSFTVLSPGRSSWFQKRACTNFVDDCGCCCFYWSE